MLKEAVRHFKTACMLVFILTFLTGLIYPLLVTGMAQIFFPWQANGSLLKRNGQNIGSLLIGQSFTDPSYFWGRPSATSPFPYNGEASSGSNSGPSNLTYLTTVKERIMHLKKNNLSNDILIPVDLVTASASGLDPDISPLAAHYQIPRIAKTRHLPEHVIAELIQQQMKPHIYSLLGEPHINVLQLNLALDNLRKTHGQSTPKS